MYWTNYWKECNGNDNLCDVSVKLGCLTVLELSYSFGKELRITILNLGICIC